MQLFPKGNDYEKFTVTSSGAVMSKGALEFDNPADNVSEFAIAYYASDGRIFTQQIELTVRYFCRQFVDHRRRKS